MFKKIIIASLLAATVFAITACHNDANKDIQDADSVRKLYNEALEIDLTELENWASEYVELELNDINNKRDEYPVFPIEALLYDKPGTNPLTGNRYFVYCLITDIYVSIDGLDAYRFFIMDESGTYGDIVIVGSDSQKGWGEFSEETPLILYFEYVGFSKELDSHFGIYQFHEELL